MGKIDEGKADLLFEILVVITIIALLAGLVGPRLYRTWLAQSKTAKAQIELFGTALDAFRLDTGRYPTTEEGFKALREKPSGVGHVARSLSPEGNTE